MTDGRASGGLGTAPRLTRLELQGFKSFATRTVFAFEPGITAVVGPNGSGKSNIADAVRWVLGEQGQSALRTKRGEDVIFAGGQGRAPAGLAEATLTFANADRWLPIDFAEVTVTRRTFRGGETHYLINGRRVRLKDVALLTASLGQSHVVVGQGLVDAALSQRAEERRGLFEHAADLAGLRLKIADAEKNLNEAAANAARLADLLGELEPRLRTLERAARQAREWQGVRDRLVLLQRAHYRRLIVSADATLATARAAAEREAAALAAARASVERLIGEHDAVIAALAAARIALADHDANRQALDERARRVGHERDLAAERQVALARRLDDMADIRAGLEEQRRGVAAELAEVVAALTTLQSEIEAARATAATRRTEAAAARAATAERERRIAALAAAITDAQRRATEADRRRALLAQRRQSEGAARDRLRRETAERATRLERLGDEVAAADSAADQSERDLSAITARLADLAAEGERSTAATRAAASVLAGVERAISEAAARRDALRRVQESGAGLYAGVRETLRAARAGQVAGVRGTVTELIDVPPELETAVEVALGGHLQDIVVERWADAEAAIAHLKRGNTGRATFQPIDTVRAGRARERPRAALAGPGVRGVAADLVGAADDLDEIVGALLGRMLVVDDLPNARASLANLPPGWSVVTLGGEIARAGGSLTGGAAVRESGVLGRERELRTLPAEIARLEQDRAVADQNRAIADETTTRLAEARRLAEVERAALVAAGEERRREQARLATWRDELQREQTQAEERIAAIVATDAAAAAELAELENDMEALTRQTEAETIERDQIEAELRRRDAAAAAGDQAAAEAGRRLAALEERLRAERHRQHGLHGRKRALDEELTLRGERGAALERERGELAAAHARLAAEARELDEARATVAAARAPLAAAVRRGESEETRQARALEAARAALLDRDRLHGASGLAVERAADEVAALRRRIGEELEIDDPATLLADPPTPAGTDPAAEEREIARLKERLRRVGYVGEEVVAEFEREAAHQEFLRTQLADVEGAAAALRTLLADLSGTLRARFDETFRRVSDAFAETFATLFGGGTARLLLTGGDGDEPPGIDIVAQPPGKRLQSLALLSGGERALTAGALLFAILQVNPAPFCLLDEVDAALDEANVVRFREQLRSLAARTQVIVITHNRGTIEIADTLYGVSMGTDGVSKVLSLRLVETVAD